MALPPCHGFPDTPRCSSAMPVHRRPESRPAARCLIGRRLRAGLPGQGQRHQGRTAGAEAGVRGASRQRYPGCGGEWIDMGRSVNPESAVGERRNRLAHGNIELLPNCGAVEMLTYREISADSEFLLSLQRCGRFNFRIWVEGSDCACRRTRATRCRPEEPAPGDRHPFSSLSA
jgi:hypothetical protein